MHALEDRDSACSEVPPVKLAVCEESDPGLIHLKPNDGVRFFHPQDEVPTLHRHLVGSNSASDCAVLTENGKADTTRLTPLGIGKPSQGLRDCIPFQIIVLSPHPSSQSWVCRIANSQPDLDFGESTLRLALNAAIVSFESRLNITSGK